MGAFRLLLAALVVLGHVGVSFRDYNPGVTAVVSFFLLSGYVMTLLIRKHYPSLGHIKAFYLDRSARLFPQFLFYFAITGILVKFIDVDSPFIGGCSISNVLLNIIILPLGYFNFEGLGIEHCILLPQTWSLGLEASFYLLIPFILRLGNGSKWCAFASMLVFIFALTGVLNTDRWGYRLLPGTLFIFLVGSAFVSPKDSLSRWFPWLVWGAAGLLYGVVEIIPKLLALHYNKEVLLGLLLGIPILSVLKERRFSPLDEFLGNLSYGVFLNHFICIWSLKAFGIDVSRIRYIVLLLAISCLLSYISYNVIERPALKIRHKLRHTEAV